MKRILVILALLSTLNPSLLTSHAATTINPTNSFAYGANLGWMDWRGDTNHGAVIGEYVCSGYVYSANAGWINLGSGAPTNGVYYQNLAAADFGVNQDGLGNLRGYAWGANIGWVNFENTGAPRVDLKTGQFSGYAYSANCGWISLSNALALIQTDTIAPGVDSDGDGIADAYEYAWFHDLTTAGASSDSDGDGVSDKDEYLADTDPTDPGDFLRITFITHGLTTSTNTTLQWTSKPTRCYAIQERLTLEAATPWTESYLLPLPGANNKTFDEATP
jgi:Bacterial TSP3 repeat